MKLNPMCCRLKNIQIYGHITPYKLLIRIAAKVLLGWSKETTEFFVVTVPIGGGLGAAATVLPVLLHPRKLLLRLITGKKISQMC